MLHPDRFNYTPQTRKWGVVVHDSESPPDSLEGLLRLMARPGDHHEPDGSVWGSAYHAITDGKGGYVQVAPAGMGPFAAPPTNSTHWQLCIPGYVSQTRQQWMEGLPRLHIRGTAQFIVDKWNEDGRSWPLLYCDTAALIAGAHGYTAHFNVSLAWHQSTHTDPMPNFPWDLLAADIDELAAPATNPTRDLPPSKPSIPTGEPIMPIIVYTKNDRGAWLWNPTDGWLIHLGDMDSTEGTLPTWGTPEKGIGEGDLDRLIAKYAPGAT